MSVSPGRLIKRRIAEPRGEQFGHALEHFILMELAAHASYSELQYDIHFWRTRSGLEVDFILGAGEVAIEVKGSSHVHDRELRPLRAFRSGAPAAGGAGGEHRARWSVRSAASASCRGRAS